MFAGTLPTNDHKINCAIWCYLCWEIIETINYHSWNIGGCSNTHEHTMLLCELCHVVSVQNIFLAYKYRKLTLSRHTWNHVSPGFRSPLRVNQRVILVTVLLYVMGDIYLCSQLFCTGQSDNCMLISAHISKFHKNLFVHSECQT